MTLKSLQLLQKFKYDPRYDINKVRIFYVDRGAVDDESSVDGSMLLESNTKFGFKIFEPIGESKLIPYHRISRIDYDGKCVFSRLTISAADQNMVLGNDFLKSQHEQRQKKSEKHWNENLR